MPTKEYKVRFDDDDNIVDILGGGSSKTHPRNESGNGLSKLSSMSTDTRRN